MHLIVLVNCLLIGTCLIFACLYPRIGHLLRYSGAVCGLIYITSLPFVVQIALAYKAGKPVILKICVFIVYLALGTANFVGQITLPN